MAKYPLQDVLVIKQKRVENAELVVKEKRQILEQEQEILKQRQAERDKVLQHHDEKLAQLRGELDHSTTSPKIQQMKAYLKVVKEKLKVEEKKVVDQKIKVDAAEKNLQEAKKQLQIRRQEVDKIEIHCDEWKKEQRKVDEINEERAFDEIGNVIYGIHHRKKKSAEF